MNFIWGTGKNLINQEEIVMGNLKNKIEQFKRCGWILYDVIDFNDGKKSVNYIFVSGNERRVIYTQNGIIKAIDIA